jgi:hypothetical protein
MTYRVCAVSLTALGLQLAACSSSQSADNPTYGNTGSGSGGEGATGQDSGGATGQGTGASAASGQGTGGAVGSSGGGPATGAAPSSGGTGSPSSGGTSSSSGGATGTTGGTGAVTASGGTATITGGAANSTGGVPCVPTTCAAQGKNCGTMSDLCGGSLDCGTCLTGMQCGVTVANRCGCPAGTATQLTGTVFAPNGTLPIPHALVYVPNGDTVSPFGVQPFVDGVADGNGCSCTVSGFPIAQATTATDGTFTLTNMPAGPGTPLVIQLGKWRRLVTFDVPACVTTQVPATLTRLPTRQNEGSPVDSIPLMALATGNVDGMECVLRKMGIEDSQFTNAGGTGRIRFYRDNGARLNNQTPAYGQLTASQAAVDQYDAIIFPCRGSAHDESAAAKQVVLDVATNMNAYVNKGGRAFFSHYSYAWLYNTAPSNQLPWLGTTTQAVDGYKWPSAPATIQAQVVTTFPRGQTFADWLALPAVNALAPAGATPPQIQIAEARENMHTPVNPTIPIETAQEWVTTYNTSPNPMAAQYVTFDAPWGLPATQQCGRVLWSAFHVTTGTTGNATFPAECTGTITAQEKVLAYMLFDMTSTVNPAEC